MNERYALHDTDEGVFWYYMGTGPGKAYLADGEEMRESVGVRGWWASDHVAQVIERVLPGGRDFAHFALVPEVTPTDDLPATVLADVYHEWEEDPDLARRTGLYQEVYVDRPERTERVEGPWDVLEAAPVEPDGLTWSADMPFALRNWSEYAHLFPGKFSGFRGALIARLKQIRGVSAYDQSGFSVYAKVRYSPPARLRDSTGRTKTYEETTITLDLNPPNEVRGKNRAEARAAWDAAMERFVTQVREAVAPAQCGHCLGRGSVFGGQA